jgi:type I restriction enzyme R subunit
MLLYEAPFTDFDSLGVSGVFDPPDVKRIVQVLRDIEPRTAA